MNLKVLLISVISLSSLQPAWSVSDSLDYSDAIRIIEVWLDAEKEFNRYPGLSAAIIDDQEILWKGAFGYANPDGEVESTTQTIYSICSISKLFTAIGIMQLRDRGLLSLESRVKELLPWFDLPQVFEDSEAITVRSLLTHSSGLPRETNHPYWTGPDFPFPDKYSIMDELKNQETLYPASTYFQYSNLGLTLLGYIIEEVSGQTYDTYIRENILGPLGLSNTKTSLPEDKYGSQLAKGFSALTRQGLRHPVNLFQGNGIAPAAGFSSTVEDLGTFVSWQFRLLENGGHEILNAATLKEMHRVHFLDPNWSTSWGLGFSVRKSDGQIVVGHGGSCPGYRSQLMLIPKKKLASVVMFNAGAINTNRYASGLLRLIQKVKFTKPDTLGLEEYTGFYNTQPWGSEEVIVRLNGQLAFLYLPNENPAENMTFLKHIEGDIFRRIRNDEELGETVVFHRDDSGKITHYVQHNNISRRLSDL